MHKFQASPQQPNSLRTKKYWLKTISVVAVAVMVTVILTAQITVTQVTQASSGSLTGYAPGTYTHDVLCRSIVLNPTGMFLTGFNVPDQAKNATLQGKYTVVDNATNNSCTMIIWSQQEFLNYFSGKNAVPCYNKDFMPKSSDTLNITLSKGNYMITISASCVYTQILETELHLNFTVQG
jgi:hypothetical protein